MATRPPSSAPPPPPPPSPTPTPPPPFSPPNQIFVTPCSSATSVCSASCPELCRAPPSPYFPPFQYSGDPPSSDDSHSLSPLLIVLISILAAAFLLVSYYAFSRSSFFRRNRGGTHSSDRQFESQQSATQVLDPNTGLDESLINRIALLKYKKNDGLVVSTDCSVCLGEFREEESLRLMPECTHVFHMECIDKWLESHSNCPICRTGVLSVPQPVQARSLPVPVPVQVPPRERENRNSGNVNGNDNVINVNNTPLGRERERGGGGLVVIVDPGPVGRVHEIFEVGGDDPSRPVSRQAMFVGRDMKPMKSNLMR